MRQMKFYLSNSISVVHKGREHVTVPAGTKIKLIRRADMKRGNQMLEVLNRAENESFGKGWRIVQIIDKVAPLRKNHRVCVKVENIGVEDTRGKK